MWDPISELIGIARAELCSTYTSSCGSSNAGSKLVLGIGMILDFKVS